MRILQFLEIYIFARTLTVLARHTPLLMTWLFEDWLNSCKPEHLPYEIHNTICVLAPHGTYFARIDVCNICLPEHPKYMG